MWVRGSGISDESAQQGPAEVQQPNQAPGAMPWRGHATPRCGRASCSPARRASGRRRRGVDTERTLTRHKKEATFISNNTDEPGGHYAKWDEASYETNPV